jgi:hypothetical protein
MASSGIRLGLGIILDGDTSNQLRMRKNDCEMIVYAGDEEEYFLLSISSLMMN